MFTSVTAIQEWCSHYCPFNFNNTMKPFQFSSFKTCSHQSLQYKRCSHYCPFDICATTSLRWWQRICDLNDSALTNDASHRSQANHFPSGSAVLLLQSAELVSTGTAQRVLKQVPCGEFGGGVAVPMHSWKSKHSSDTSGTSNRQLGEFQRGCGRRASTGSGRLISCTSACLANGWSDCAFGG
jgi:hypothetical protein